MNHDRTETDVNDTATPLERELDIVDRLPHYLVSLSLAAGGSTVLGAVDRHGAAFIEDPNDRRLAA